MQIEEKKPTTMDKFSSSKTKQVHFNIPPTQYDSNLYSQTKNTIQNGLEIGSKSAKSLKEKNIEHLKYQIESPLNLGKRYQTSRKAPRCNIIIIYNILMEIKFIR